jgi:ABC-type lipoprotein export system ATPase subunit
VRIPEPLLREVGHPREFDVAYDGGEIVLRPLAETEVEAPAEAEAVIAPDGDAVVVAALDRVTKRFGRAEEAVLEEVGCSFAAGTFTAVVGRSGSGKTTLLHLLAGLDRPTSGSVTLVGRLLDGLDRTELAALRRRHVALVTQEPGLIPYLTAAENTQLALALRGRADDDLALVERVLADVSLEHRADMAAAKLSAGERQRLAVARALAAGTELLLMDEPTARLDEENAHAVAGLLGRAARVHGLAVVCATHDPVLIEAADTILPLARSIDRVDVLPAV